MLSGWNEGTGNVRGRFLAILLIHSSGWRVDLPGVSVHVQLHHACPDPTTGRNAQGSTPRDTHPMTDTGSSD